MRAAVVGPNPEQHLPVRLVPQQRVQVGSGEHVDAVDGEDHVADPDLDARPGEG